MNNTAKIVLAIIVGILGLCLCSSGLVFLLLFPLTQLIQQTSVNIPGAVQIIGVETVDPTNRVQYQLPPGYHEQYSVTIGGLAINGAVGGDPHAHITFMHIPARIIINRDQLEQQARDEAQNRNVSRYNRMQVVGQSNVVIRGREVVMTIREGTNSDGERYREMSGLFDGRSGSVLLVIAGPTDTWNQPQLDTFISSIN